MTGAEFDDFGAMRGGEGGDTVAKLPIRIVAVGIEKRGGELDFERLVRLQQVDHRGWVD